MLFLSRNKKMFKHLSSKLLTNISNEVWKVKYRWHIPNITSAVSSNTSSVSFSISRLRLARSLDKLRTSSPSRRCSSALTLSLSASISTCLSRNFRLSASSRWWIWSHKTAQYCWYSYSNKMRKSLPSALCDNSHSLTMFGQWLKAYLLGQRWASTGATAVALLQFWCMTCLQFTTFHIFARLILIMPVCKCFLFLRDS